MIKINTAKLSLDGVALIHRRMGVCVVSGSRMLHV